MAALRGPRHIFLKSTKSNKGSENAKKFQTKCLPINPYNAFSDLLTYRTVGGPLDTPEKTAYSPSPLLIAPEPTIRRQPGPCPPVEA